MMFLCLFDPAGLLGDGNRRLHDFVVDFA